MILSVRCFHFASCVCYSIRTAVKKSNTLGSASLLLRYRECPVPCSKLRSLLHVTRCYKHEDTTDGDITSDSDEMNHEFELYNESGGKNSSVDLRNFLYPSSTDPIICQLNSCVSVQDVFDVLKMHKKEMKGRHASQAVLILWDMQKAFVRVNVLEEVKITVSDPFLKPKMIIENYITNIQMHEDFVSLLELVGKGVQDLSADAVTCTLLYLNKMGLQMNHPLMQNLVAHCETLIDFLGSEFPLTAMSRFTVAVCQPCNLWSYFVLQKSLPLIFSKLETCNSVGDLHLLTICLSNLPWVIGSATLETFKMKVEALFRSGDITVENARIILKIISFLNLRQWSHNNTTTVQLLLNVFKGKAALLKSQDLVALLKIVQGQLEPADLLEEIQQCARRYLYQEDELSEAMQPCADLLSCVAFCPPPAQKNTLDKLISHHLTHKNFSASVVPLYKALRNVKTSNVHLCNTYWSKVVKNLELHSDERKDDRLLTYCHRYMYFNNNLGGTYRYYKFENCAIYFLLNGISNDISGLIPSKFSRIASFLLAYGSMKNYQLSDHILKLMVDKITEMAPQFTVFDCQNISRGLQIARTLPHSSSRLHQVNDYFCKINMVLQNCVTNHLKNGRSTIPDINMMMRTCFSSKQSDANPELFQKLIDRYKKCEGELSTRLLRDTVSNLLMSGCLIPEIIDRLVGYVIKKNVNILGGTAGKVLYLCYSQGYTPTNASAFLDVAADVIVRDKEHLNGLTLLQVALALCFFHHLPEQLMHFIFTVDFLERLDIEISQCYSKDSFPVRVRQHMMQLNRAVCLDYPEHDIPWFHDKYCQQVAAFEPTQVSPLYTDVEETLIEVLGGKEHTTTNAHTAYGYNIDFLVVLNHEDIPVTIKHQSDKNTNRIAILLLTEDDFTTNVCSLKGHHQMKQQHLEILGYNVRHLNSTLWNSTHANKPGAKQNILKDLIWPSNKLTS